MKTDQSRVKKLIGDTIVLLCQQGLSYSMELRVQGLVAVTVDRHETFVVQIDATESKNKKPQNPSLEKWKDQPNDDVIVLPLVDLTQAEEPRNVPVVPLNSVSGNQTPVGGCRIPKGQFPQRSMSQSFGGSPQLSPLMATSFVHRTAHHTPNQFCNGPRLSRPPPTTPSPVSKSPMTPCRSQRQTRDAVMVIDDEKDDIVIVASHLQVAEGNRANETRDRLPCSLPRDFPSDSQRSSSWNTQRQSSAKQTLPSSLDSNLNNNGYLASVKFSQNSKSDSSDFLPVSVTSSFEPSSLPLLSPIGVDSWRQNTVNQNCVKTSVGTGASLVASSATCSPGIPVNSQLRDDATATANGSMGPKLTEQHHLGGSSVSLNGSVGNSDLVRESYPQRSSASDGDCCRFARDEKFSCSLSNLVTSGTNVGVILTGASQLKGSVVSASGANPHKYEIIDQCVSVTSMLPCSNLLKTESCDVLSKTVGYLERLEVIPRPKITLAAEIQHLPLHNLGDIISLGTELMSNAVELKQVKRPLDGASPNEKTHPMVYTDIADNSNDSRQNLVNDVDNELLDTDQLIMPYHCKFPGCVGSYVDDAQLANHYSITHAELHVSQSEKQPGTEETKPSSNGNLVPDESVKIIRDVRSLFSCPNKGCDFIAESFSEVSVHHKQAHVRSISPRVRQQMLWRHRSQKMSDANVADANRLQDSQALIVSSTLPVSSTHATSAQAVAIDTVPPSKKALYSCPNPDGICHWMTSDWNALLTHLQQVHSIIFEPLGEAVARVKAESHDTQDGTFHGAY